MAYLNSTFTSYLQTSIRKTMEITKQTDLQEKFLNKQNEINRLKRIYYYDDEKLVLPKHPRYYYDWLSSRYNS